MSDRGARAVRSLWAAHRLERHRIGVRPGARLGAVAAIGVALVSAQAVATGTGGVEQGATTVASALRWSAWLGAGPLAVSIASGGRDGDEGLSALAFVHGVPPGRLEVGYWIAAALAGSWRVALPAIVACVAGVVVAPSPSWLRLALGAAVAGVVVGTTVASLAAGCRRLVEGRGRLTLLAVVLLPWMASGPRGRGWSVPELLDQVIRTLTLGGPS